MRFSLIICTYMRPKPLLKLLKSVEKQTVYPDEILIIDGSTNTETETALKSNAFKDLTYYRVSEKDRGLTKQRNYGIKNVSNASEIICFLDDDIILEPDYFKQLIGTYSLKPDALAVGGYITNAVHWKPSDSQNNPSKFYFDGWMREEPVRFKLRRRFGLQPDVPPGFMPSFSHGRSIGFLPPSGKIYDVEQIMGGVSSYKKSVFNTLSFSTYFEGYGLYEDADFSLRIAKQGKLFVNTNARLEHHHEASGRPDTFKYGKMVVRNGWYVWRVKYSTPNLKSTLKWHATSFLLTGIRFVNVVSASGKKETLMEALGRVFGWFSLIFNKPKVE
ncbi:glycosyltransferase [Flavobacteriaceae bacterium XHP0103]|uniref:glycosyltransferase family 2 protein n=1 Tax=Marixanthotalea marina TaxID=2844359 RepID=UPI00298A0602|nr:glycosyltransferase [Marixanthotalea marina]MBU3822725.1 glycosyltransferase [Marixanthotalea marina]